MSKSIVFKPKYQLGKGQRYCTEKEAFVHDKINVYGLHPLSPKMRDIFLESLIIPVMKIKNARHPPSIEKKQLAEELNVSLPPKSETEAWKEHAAEYKSDTGTREEIEEYNKPAKRSRREEISPPAKSEETKTPEVKSSKYGNLTKWTQFVAEHKGERKRDEPWREFMGRLSTKYHAKN
jgi:hypothetical protein